MKITQIKKSFWALKYIIYRNQFLIPQRPQRVPSKYTFILKSLKSEISQLVKERSEQESSKIGLAHKIIKENLDKKNPLFTEVEKQQTLMQEQYHRKMQQYKQQYLDSSKVSKASLPYCLFLKEELTKRSKERNIENRKQWKEQFKRVGDLWKKLSDEEKQKLTKKCEKVRFESMERAMKYYTQHEIPWNPSFKKGDRYFLSSYFTIEIQLGKIKLVEKKQYQILDPDKKMKVKQKSQRIKEEASAKLEEFLNKWELTYEGLLYIKEICDKHHAIAYNRKISFQKQDLFQEKNDH